MLCFIGLGINGYSGLSLLAKETLQKCHFIYIERFTVPKSQNDNLPTSISSFSGNGNLNGIKVSATGNEVMVPREYGNSSITDGRALFTTKNFTKQW